MTLITIWSCPDFHKVCSRSIFFEVFSFLFEKKNKKFPETSIREGKLKVTNEMRMKILDMFWLPTTRKSRADAEKHCMNHGGRLLRLETKEKFDNLTKFLNMIGQDEISSELLWLGGKFVCCFRFVP